MKKKKKYYKKDRNTKKWLLYDGIKMKNDKASNCDNNDSNNHKNSATATTAAAESSSLKSFSLNFRPKQTERRKNQPKQLQMSTKVCVDVRKISLNCWKMPNANWSSENP